MRRRRASLASGVLSVVLLAASVPATAAAVDVTPPVGSMELWSIDNETQLAELHLSYSDPESGIDHVVVVCDNGPEFNIPYASKIVWHLHDGSGGCTTTYGEHSIMVRVYNGAGLDANPAFASVTNEPTVHLTVSANPTTGHPITFTPVWSSDYIPPPDQICSWELRWGTTTALDQTNTGDTFGGMTNYIPASEGGCGPWTFTLPWVPYPQFDVRFGGHPVRFMAAVDSTDRHIQASNLPVAQVLPNTYTPIVGEPITYTRYLLGGLSAYGPGYWNARLGAGETPKAWGQTGGSTFTITPTIAGDLFVEWNQEPPGGSFADAYYDPPVRYRDSTAPVVTSPRQRIRGSVVGPTIPLTIDWTGSDKGWGIASYQLQKSTNGGAWAPVALTSPTAKAVSVNASPGATLRFRVRAKDKAGHVGSWAYGPTFKAVSVSDTSTRIIYTSGRWKSVVDGTALGGVLHKTSLAASASYRVSARAIAWVAGRGPGHGKAKVYIDGVLRATIDLGARTDARHVVFAYRWSSLAIHTIRIVNAVTAGRPMIDVDGVIVLR